LLTQQGNTGCPPLFRTNIKQGSLVAVLHFPSLYEARGDTHEMFSFNILSVLILAVPKVE